MVEPFLNILGKEKATVKAMIPVRIFWDEEAEVWVAIGDGIGLVLESESYDTLIQRIRVAAPEMAAENGIKCTAGDFHIFPRRGCRENRF